MSSKLASFKSATPYRQTGTIKAGTILIIAMVTIPMVLFLFLFSTEIYLWLVEAFAQLMVDHG